MGLQRDIGFVPKRPNAPQRLAQHIGMTRTGTALLSRSLQGIDRSLHRLSNGRATFAAALGGFPIIMLTTTGARSGVARTHPLTGIPFAGDLAVVGTNYGLSKIPAWSHNLRANPRAVATYRQATLPVIARPAADAEVEEISAAAILIYPGYELYRRTSTDPIPVFVLEAADERI